MKPIPILALSSILLTGAVATANAFVCSRELMEWGQAQEGSLECLVDDTLSELLRPMGFQPGENVSTEMVSANLGEADGRPLITYLFHYAIHADQIDALFQKWSKDRPGFAALAGDLEDRVQARICEVRAGEASFLDVGGRANIVVMLTSSDLGQGKFFYEKLTSFDLTTCEAP